jgi:hypothetical protein
MGGRSRPAYGKRGGKHADSPETADLRGKMCYFGAALPAYLVTRVPFPSVMTVMESAAGPPSSLKSKESFDVHFCVKRKYIVLPSMVCWLDRASERMALRAASLSLLRSGVRFDLRQSDRGALDKVAEPLRKGRPIP